MEANENSKEYQEKTKKKYFGHLLDDEIGLKNASENFEAFFCIYLRIF